MKRIYGFIGLALTLLLMACATPYQSLSINGGYKDLPLQEDVYLVTYQGNGYTSAETVASYLFRRASELTLTHGYKYFMILKAAGYNHQTYHTTPIFYNQQSQYTGLGNYYTHASISGGQVYTINRYSGSIIVKMTNQKLENAYDARLILNHFLETN